MTPHCANHPARCWHVPNGNNVVMGQQVCTIRYDSMMHRFVGYGSVQNVVIGDDVTISTRGSILQDVTIGNRVMIGARAVVTRDIPDNSIAVGNLAKVIGTFDAILRNTKKRCRPNPSLMNTI